MQSFKLRCHLVFQFFFLLFFERFNKYWIFWMWSWPPCKRKLFAFSAMNAFCQGLFSIIQWLFMSGFVAALGILLHWTSCTVDIYICSWFHCTFLRKYRANCVFFLGGIARTCKWMFTNNRKFCFCQPNDGKLNGTKKKPEWKWNRQRDSDRNKNRERQHSYRLCLAFTTNNSNSQPTPKW